MDTKLSKSAQRVQHILEKKGFYFNVLELPESTRTAQDAAEAVDCSLSQIAKSIIFKNAATNRPILAVVSGANRADVSKLTDLVNGTVENVDADYVRRRTGFAIGGVSPVGHTEDVQTFIDEDLLAFDEIWAAAGTPNTLFMLHSDDLIVLTGGTVVNLKE